MLRALGKQTSVIARVRAFSTTTPTLTTPATPFSFLPANSLALKPKNAGTGLSMKSRESGITEIRGPYYAPVTKTYLDELLGDWGEYVDGVKFAGGAFSLMPEDRLKALIDVAHKHDTYVSTGGYIERVLAASAGNNNVVEKYVKTCRDMGFDVVELSSGFLSIPTKDWAELIALVTKYGMKAKPEVGIQLS
ncbi:2r-phospho-3-sulfolactate synthase coma [Punctularia strigosozonata HHB-11173 SS5]|uniref:2r-phospho-3-sulfolactate synthase coma n=1 Tax=Punctularia strigosozonata (strain HHB-11173) TaxID=741275 RepID=UPI0004418736|nr:2r-phospho-3-sulfolactate synthase coma [Punctularia strigosozonata HHB-11173 SS5]EIN12957.1 2r-phospho-3-sulfolactate synthase coma [Punctularia strigosozonata HHB-11173 SS5]